MEIINPGYYFWRSYFDKKEEDREKELCDFNFQGKSKKELEVPGYNKTFYMKTIYPGLVTGVGMPHEVAGDNTFILGFYFDYTTGLPVIPGSTVKGVLKSVFPQWKNEQEESEKKMLKTNYICTLLGENKSDTDAKKFVIQLENEIFEGVGENGALGVYQRDLFFDAYIEKGYIKQEEQSNERELIFGKDYITPHVKEGMSYEESVLKEPTPLPFLKILPGVTFCFSFYLTNGVIGVKEKMDLFKKILQDIGIGAKTNVGYGQLEVVDDVNNGKQK